MKKTIIVILSIFLMIIICIYMNYKKVMIDQNQTKKFNSEYEFYNRDTILGTDITTIINKAIDNNEKYNIKKDEKDLYIPDDKYSIKIYIYLAKDNEDEITIPMEGLVKNGLEQFTKLFGEIEFKCSDVKYHESTGRIAEMTFKSDEY